MTSGFFQRLFSITKNAHIISPHRNLDKFIHERFGVTIHNVLIPSEHHPLVTPISISSPHFPDVYDSIASWIKETRPALVLVAGGVFGKIYSGMICELGGVAIDIGSVVDSLDGAAYPAVKNGMGGTSKGFVGRMRWQESCDEGARITYHGKSTFADRLVQLTGDRNQPRLITREQLGPRALPRVQVVAKHGHYPEYPAMVPSQNKLRLGGNVTRLALRMQASR